MAASEMPALGLDVTDQASARAAVAKTVEHFGALDILVNNAGVMLAGPIEGADTAEWVRMVETNLLGSMFVVHAALPYLLERRGTVVQVSSTSGRMASAGDAVYSATKFGVTAFAEPLRQEPEHVAINKILVRPTDQTR
ncbi:SDR family NAD(P)-dependent oxidoreductase [Nonomuraea sp. SBT364]|uniref:SDR family NAD(P)-dependent oxidoreductase n=1 Tax=Nonomuraea sp. SBT364 TaxID=1580530 RepID=UPI000A98BBCA|nr:SDR family NAD(P)-dependent oxidoreductase [Nonomuraea sp. SBT364]